MPPVARLAAWSVALGLACATTASAEPAGPHRLRVSRAPAKAHAAPDVTGSIRTPPPSPTLPEPQPVDPPLGPPFKLPTASRARLRSCGEQWQARKMSGQAGSDTWREFAMVCLTRKDDDVAAP